MGKARHALPALAALWALTVLAAHPATAQDTTTTASANNNEGCDDGTDGGLSTEANTRFAVCVSLLCMLVTFCVSHYVEHVRAVTVLPEASVAVVVGVVCSGVFAWLQAGDADHINQYMRFDKDFFFVWLLPPIIFEAGYNMKRKEFFENITPTLLFAFVGTFVSTFVVGGLVYGAGQLGWCHELRVLPSLVFGALISATDPVTVLAVFQSLGVDINLFSMVFGESVLNDAVALVLYRTLMGFKCIEFSAEHVAAAVGLFLQIFLLSVVIGTLAGMLSALTSKKLDLRASDENKFLEALLTAVFPWTAYFLAEAFEFSGIVAILFCGITMAHYTYENLSPDVQRLSREMYKVIAKAAETFVFVYLGMSIFSFHMAGGSLVMLHHTKFKLVVIAIVACLIARVFVVVPNALLANFLHRKSGRPPVPTAFMILLWFSGLRGGVAFAIAATNYSEREFPDNEESLAILQTTLYVAVFTILVFGGGIARLAVRLNVLEGPGVERHYEPSGLTLRGGAKRTATHSRLLDFDRRVVKPFLTFPRPSGHRHDRLGADEGEEGERQPMAGAASARSSVLPRELQELGHDDGQGVALVPE